MPTDLGLRIGAGDGNRTRTVSLGINRQAKVTAPDLGARVSMSDRDGPWLTTLNGTLMARRSWSWLVSAQSAYSSPVVLVAAEPR
jgi:hypothetical protein